VNMDEVNMDEVNMDEVNMNEVNVNEVNVNEVNQESTLNEESGEVCDGKEGISKGKSLDIEAKVEVNEKSKEVVTAKPPDVLQRFDFTAKVQVEEFSMKVVKNSEEEKNLEDAEEVEKRLQLLKEVMQIDNLKMKEESRRVNWDPGEPVNAKAHTEMSDAKEEKMLVNNGKVGLRGDVNWKAFYDAMALYSIVRFNFKAMLIVLLLTRFVNGFRRKCPIELSDYG